MHASSLHALLDACCGLWTLGSEHRQAAFNLLLSGSHGVGGILPATCMPVQAFDLIEPRELSPLLELIDQMLL